MPELPEVETVRRILSAHCRGRVVRRVEGRPVMMRRPLDPERLADRLRGANLTAFRRRGKYLLIDAGVRGSVLIHLGMSGRLMLQGPDDPVLGHTHLVLGLDDRRQLRLVDPRRFGFAQWLDPGAETLDPSLASLGVEPLDSDLGRLWPQLVAGRSAPLKALLLDQRLVAGIGNIYANEALWRAGIHPRRAPRRTSAARLARLGAAVREVLAEAVAQGGTTIRDFASPEGDFGYFKVHLAVYERSGQPCLRCGTRLRTAAVAGRATTWCSRCQR